MKVRFPPRNVINTFNFSISVAACNIIIHPAISYLLLLGGKIICSNYFRSIDGTFARNGNTVTMASFRHGQVGFSHQAGGVRAIPRKTHQIKVP